MRKLTHEYVFNFYKEYNYTMNSHYISGQKKDKLTCPVGHEIEMRFNGFQQGKRCYKCKIEQLAKSQALSHEYVFNYYKKYGYELKSIYKNSKNKDELICPNGHEIQMRFNAFKTHNRRCRICYEDNIKGESHPNWKIDRTRKIRASYLKFNLDNIHILSDDSNYNNYLESQEIAKNSDEIWSKSKYSVDHIFPRIAFIDNDLDIKFDKKIIRDICNSRDNLRIVLMEENQSKSGKYDNDEFMKWFYNKLDEK